MQERFSPDAPRPADQRPFAVTSLSSAHAALILAVASNRDRQAFAELFDFYAPRIEGWLIRAGVERTLAEEICQDAMTTLWRKAALYDPAKATPATWLYRIARNRRIDLARRDRVTLMEPGDAAFDIVDENAVDPDADCGRARPRGRPAHRARPASRRATRTRAHGVLRKPLPFGHRRANRPAAGHGQIAHHGWRSDACEKPLKAQGWKTPSNLSIMPHARRPERARRRRGTPWRRSHSRSTAGR